MRKGSGRRICEKCHADTHSGDAGIVESCDADGCESFEKYCTDCAKGWAVCDYCGHNSCPDCDAVKEHSTKYWPCCETGGVSQLLCRECRTGEDDEEETEEEHGCYECAVCASKCCADGECAPCAAKKLQEALDTKATQDAATKALDAHTAKADAALVGTFLARKSGVRGPSLRGLLEGWLKTTGTLEAPSTNKKKAKSATEAPSTKKKKARTA